MFRRPLNKRSDHPKRPNRATRSRTDTYGGIEVVFSLEQGVSSIGHDRSSSKSWRVHFWLTRRRGIRKWPMAFSVAAHGNVKKGMDMIAAAILRAAVIGLMVPIILSSSLVLAAEPKAAWQADWDKTVKAAEEERELVIYMTQAFEPVFREAFQKKYPKIKVTMVTGRGPELSQRIMSERRADKFMYGSLHIGKHNSLDCISPRQNSRTH